MVWCGMASNFLNYHDKEECSNRLPSVFLTLDIFIPIYYTTKAVRGPITKINQSDRSNAGPIFPKYWTGYCPE